MERMNSSWKTFFRILSRRTSQPSKAGQHSSPGNTENTTEIFLKKSNPRHIIVRFTRVELKEKMLRAAREKSRVTHKGKPIRLTADLSAKPTSQKRVGANIQHP